MSLIIIHLISIKKNSKIKKDYNLYIYTTGCYNLNSHKI